MLFLCKCQICVDYVQMSTFAELELLSCMKALVKEVLRGSCISSLFLQQAIRGISQRQVEG